MTRISTVCVLSGTLAVLAFSANMAMLERHRSRNGAERKDPAGEERWEH